MSDDLHDSSTASQSWSGDSTVPGGERDESFAPESGTVVDRYTVLSTLGRGASGVVVAAFDPKLDRKVALKFLYREVAGDADHARLKREAQALARLTHPNVIRVHDVGTYQGRVFMATELVEGSDLATWRETSKPSWREVVRVMLAAGEGLAAAHSAGLVHRDFKPRNVLVGHDGRPRVTDFGQARGYEEAHPSDRERTLSETNQLQGSDLDHPVLDTTLTRSGALVGTPAYMSPEALQGAPPDPRADQFGFCVSLYEMLWGRRPFLGNTMASLAIAIENGQIEAPPALPRVPRGLRAALWKGLSVDSELRHPSMRALLRAMRRAIYWPRRVAWVVLPATVATATAVVAWPSIPLTEDYCAQHERRLERAWGPAQQDQIEDAFVATGLGYAPQTWTRVRAHVDGVAQTWLTAQHETCEALAAGEAVDDRMLCLHRRYQELHSLVGVLSQADDKVVQHAVEAARALELDAACDEERRSTMPADPEARRQRERIDAVISQARVALNAGRRSEALDAARAAVALAEGTGQRWSEAEAKLALALALDDDGDPKPVEAALDAAYTAALAAKHDVVVAEAAMGVAGSVARRGEFTEADRWLDLAQVAVERSNDGTNQLESTLENTRGRVAHHHGDFAGGLTHFRASLALDEDHGRGDDPTHGGVLLNIGLSLANLGRYDESLEALEDALAREQYNYGEGHPRVVRVLNTMCHVRGYAGQIEAALQACNQGITYVRANGGERSPQLVHLHTNLGVVLFRAGRLAETETAYTQALRLGEEIYGNADPLVGNLLNNLGVLYVEMGEHGKAQEIYGRAMVLFEGVFGSEHPTTGILRTNLAMAFANDGKLDEAEHLVLESIAVLERTLGKDHVDMALSLAELARIHERRGQLPEAVPLFERAIELREAAGGEPLELADSKYGLGLVVWELGERARARALLTQARTLYDQSGGEWSKRVEELDQWLSEHPQR
ncbi:MAG: serine/threonine-protein kinase [Deltaproteobacteria bacterium]|nr:serine/threonine-protein kinase [Deltaproteobacteria bacterium]